VESQHTVIFVDFLAGNLPGNNFTKNAVVHTGSIAGKKYTRKTGANFWDAGKTAR
jgi:hypothetical protein